MYECHHSMPDIMILGSFSATGNVAQITVVWVVLAFSENNPSTCIFVFNLPYELQTYRLLRLKLVAIIPA